MTTQHFFLRGVHLGSREIPTYRDREGLGLGVAGSYLLVCSKCQDVWARVLHDHFDSHCMTLPRGCPDHIELSGDGYLSTPNMYDDNPLTIKADWPLLAIKHDLMIALKQVDEKEMV